MRIELRLNLRIIELILLLSNLVISNVIFSVSISLFTMSNVNFQKEIKNKAGKRKTVVLFKNLYNKKNDYTTFQISDARKK